MKCSKTFGWLDSRELKFVVRDNGRLSIVRCKIYNVVEHGDKLFVPKFVEHCDTHHVNHSYDILGAGMLWKPKKARKFVKIRTEECFDKC
jgi:hypothetical protein